MSDEVLGASFRDPSGFVFEHDGSIYRQVNRSYAPHYDQLMESGLYAELTEQGLLIPHEAVDGMTSGWGDPHVTLRPEPIEFISYPYEWAFSQLKDAASGVGRSSSIRSPSRSTRKACRGSPTASSASTSSHPSR
jgi:hypothetical protein